MQRNSLCMANADSAEENMEKCLWYQPAVQRLGDIVLAVQRLFGEVKNSAEYEHPKSAAYAARPLAA